MTSTDTLKTAQTLREGGMPDRQADAHARAIDDAVTDGVSNLVTQADLSDLRADIYRALLIQTAVIIGAVIAMLQLLPKSS